MSRRASTWRPPVVGLLATTATAGHVLYPLFLALKTRAARLPSAPESSTPALSIVVPAYRESRVIASKIADLRANGYAGELEIVVAADDTATADEARKSGAIVVESPERRGKADALNRAFAVCKHDVVVITDANARLAPGSLARLAAWFEDDAVGAVAGEKQVSGDGGESLYWRFESWLKRAEWRSGTTIGLVGELGAIRRSALRRVPDDVTNDDLWIAIDVAAQGLRIAYEPSAVARESPSPNASIEWERRTRIIAGALDVLWRRREMLDPRRSPVAAQLWGHRLLRMSAGPLAHAGLLAVAWTSRRRSVVARSFLAGHAFAAASAFKTARNEPSNVVEGALGQALWLQAVALGGLARWARGARPVAWTKPERDAPGR